MKGRRLYKADVRKENNRIIHFLFENGEHKPNKEKLNVYDPRCLSKETCECWWFPISQKNETFFLNIFEPILCSQLAEVKTKDDQ